MKGPRLTLGDRCERVTCRGKLLFGFDPLGRTTVRCLQCERRKAGICRDCPAPVSGTVGRALRCEPCKVRAMELQDRRHALRYREEYNERNRIRRKRPEVMETSRRQRRRWAAANREKTRAAKRRYRARKRKAASTMAEMRQERAA
jgi:hypothetical protein